MQALAFPAMSWIRCGPNTGFCFGRSRVCLSGKERLDYPENRSLIRTQKCAAAMLWRTAVGAGIDISGAHNYVMHRLVVEMVVEQRASQAKIAREDLDFWLVDAYYNLANIRLTVSVAVTRAALSTDDEVGRDDAATLGSSRWTVRREDGGDHEPRRAEGADSGSRG
jgi:hypothetical protein